MRSFSSAQETSGRGLPPNKRLKLPCHSSLLPSCVTLWQHNQRFRLRGQPVARSLAANR
jgi:hypothetical protein